MEFETVQKLVAATCINLDQIGNVFDLLILKSETSEVIWKSESESIAEKLESESFKAFQPDLKYLNLPNSLRLPVPIPTFIITKERIQELNSQIDGILDCSSDSKCSRNSIEVQSSNSSDSVIYVCPLFNNKSVTILSTKILITRKTEKPSEILKTIPIGAICKIVTDKNMRIVDLVLSSSKSIMLIPEEIGETEMLINYLLIASCKISKSVNRKCPYSWPVFLEVAQCISILNLPSSVCIKESMINLGFTDRSILYAGLAILSSLDNAIGSTQEFMLQKGTEPFIPVKVTLTRNSIQLSIIGERKLEMSIPLYELSCIRKVEIPRPYSCCMRWNGTTLNLAASSRSIADEWFERMCHAKRKSELTEPLLAHIIINESILHMFSTESSKLLVQAPLLNIVAPSPSSLLGSNSGTTIAIIEIETLEAEEIISYENERWSLQFLSKADASSCLNQISNSILFTPNS